MGSAAASRGTASHGSCSRGSRRPVPCGAAGAGQVGQLPRSACPRHSYGGADLGRAVSPRLTDPARAPTAAATAATSGDAATAQPPGRYPAPPARGHALGTPGRYRPAAARRRRRCGRRCRRSPPCQASPLLRRSGQRRRAAARHRTPPTSPFRTCSLEAAACRCRSTRAHRATASNGICRRAAHACRPQGPTAASHPHRRARRPRVPRARCATQHGEGSAHVWRCPQRRRPAAAGPARDALPGPVLGPAAVGGAGPARGAVRRVTWRAGGRTCARSGGGRGVGAEQRSAAGRGRCT
jgi:hypothetical protein